MLLTEHTITDMLLTVTIYSTKLVKYWTDTLSHLERKGFLFFLIKSRSKERKRELIYFRKSFDCLRYSDSANAPSSLRFTVVKD